MIKTITIPEELKIKIQKADIERSACRDIITYLISQQDIDISNERFQRYQEEYSNKYFIFENFKKQVETDYVKKDYPNAIHWSLNYETNEITITLENE